MAPPQMGPEQALAGAEAQGQEMGMMAAEGVMQNIDGAQDYQSLIDGIRGNQQPLEARYAELGGIVGEQDAMQTPESVLALTQPAIMMTEEGAVNSGIGELMQGIAGDTSMEGQMGEGVGGLMMAQAPEPAMEAPMMEVGNTPPVNFNQGGPVEVRGYRFGDEAKAGGGSALNDLGPYLQQAQDARSNILGTPKERAAMLDEMKRANQSQALFDIAGTFLDFAGNTEGGSVAERLANSASRTQLTDKLGARAASQLQAKQSQQQQQQQMDLSALESAERQVEAERDRIGALQLAEQEQSAELLKQSKQFSFTKETNESEQEFSLRKLDRQAEIQTALTSLQGKLGIDADAARAALLAEQNQLDRALKRELQTQTLDFNKDENTSNRQHAFDLADKQFVLTKQLEVLKNDNTTEGVELRAKLNKEALRLQAALTKTQRAADFENDLTKVGIINTNDVAKIGVVQENTMALAERRIEAQEALRAAQSSDAANAAELTRNATSELAKLDRELKLTVQKNTFDFKQLDGQTSQDYAIEMAGVQLANQKVLLALQNDNTKEGIALKNRLTQDNMRLSDALLTAQKGIDVKNRLSEMGILQDYDIVKIGLNQANTMSLADKRIASQERLVELQATKGLEAQTQAETERAKLAQLDRDLRLSLQDNTFNFKRGEGQTTQDYAIELAGVQLANQKALIALQDDNTREGIELKNRLTQDNMRLSDRLTTVQKEVEFENQIARMDVKQIYDINKMDIGLEQNIALADHQAVIATEAREDAQAHAAVQQAINNAATMNRQINNQNAQTALAELRQTFTGSEAEKARLYDKAMRMIDNAFTQEGLLLKGEGLDLQSARDAVDEKYKLGKLALEEAAAKATLLGGKAKTDQIQYLTNRSRLTSYANNNLGDKTAEYEQAILDYVTKPEMYWSASEGKYVGSYPMLAPEVMATLKAANPQLYDQINKKVASEETADDRRSKFWGKNSTDIWSADFNRTLFNRDDRKVNLESETWKKVPTTYYDDTIVYGKMQGIESIGQRIDNYFSEFGREALGGKGTSLTGKKLAQADADLENLKNSMLMFSTSGAASPTDDSTRVLKFVQEELFAEVNKLKPGFLAKDDKALAQLEALAEKLGQGITLAARTLPEYGGDPSSFTESQITKARVKTDAMKLYLADVLAFRNNYRIFLSRGNPAVAPVTEASQADVEATTTGEWE